ESAEGQEESSQASSSEPAMRALELEFLVDDPALLPDMIEVHAGRSERTQVFGLDKEARCRLSVPERGAFSLTAWLPALGSWEIDGAELTSSPSQRIRVPRPATVTFPLAVPPGTSLTDVRAGICMQGLAFLSSWSGLATVRELVVDASSSSAEVRLFPGRH